MRKRWFLYALIGLVFGVLDWYFLEFLASLGQSQWLNSTQFQEPGILQLLIVVIVVGMNYGVWLIPVIPIAMVEMRLSGSLWRAALSASLVWYLALLSYYTYYAFLLMFVGLPNLGFMLFTNRHTAAYWVDWWIPFRRIIVEQFVEWIGIGLIGGAIIGLMSAYVYRYFSKRRIKKAAKTEGATA